VIACLDTSVVLASLDPDESHHVACDRLIAAGGHRLHVHALAESFSILTGGRRGRRLKPAVAARLIEHSVLPYVQPIGLEGAATMAALAECEGRGVRGGAVYDWLHLAAARIAGAEVFYTLNLRDFQALALPGDPRIELP
jgi:hypothetical protein